MIKMYYKYIFIKDLFLYFIDILIYFIFKNQIIKIYFQKQIGNDL